MGLITHKSVEEKSSLIILLSHAHGKLSKSGFKSLFMRLKLEQWNIIWARDSVIPKLQSQLVETWVFWRNLASNSRDGNMLQWASVKAQWN